MNATLRGVHRVAWPALAVGLPLALALAVSARDPVPPMDALPPPLSALSAGDGAPSVTRIDRLGVEVAAWVDRVEVRLAAPVRSPDVAVFLTSGPPGEALPADAAFLGMLGQDAVQRFLLPSPAGQLVLYSLSDATVLGAAPVGGR